jgi:predicted Rossmann fold nucleotide-binding protein DprA/Smf involved in DNA uptake
MIAPSGFIPPCLPTKVDRPPSGPLWVHEIKRDLWHTRTPPKGKPFLPLADTKRIVRRRSTMVEPKRELKMQTDRQKILAALAEKPLTTFNIMKRVNIKSQDECQTLLLKMRDEGAVKFDIHKGVWNI